MNEVKKFEELVDQLHKLTDRGAIEKKFEEIAEHLMGKLCLNVNGNRYRVAECEFYYDDGDKFRDPFLYAQHECLERFGFDKQKNKLNLFFHYSGIDITIGDGDKKRGGILIRSVELLFKIDGHKEIKFWCNPVFFADRIINSGNIDYSLNATGLTMLSISLDILDERENRDFKDKKLKSIKRVGLGAPKISINDEKITDDYKERNYNFRLPELTRTDNNEYKKYIAERATILTDINNNNESDLLCEHFIE